MLLNDIERHARREPGKPALIQDGASWSYAQFLSMILSARALLAAKGARPGSVAVLALRHLGQAWVYGIALRSLGVTTISLPANQDLRALKLEIASLVTLQDDPVDDAAAVAQLGWKHIVVPSVQPPELPGLPELPAMDVHGGHILMTSGTTGEYKMVLREPQDEYRNLPLSLPFNGVSRDSVVYAGNFPLLTAGGYRWPLMTWFAGGTVVFCQSGNPQHALLGNGVTQAYATPATLSAMLKAPDAGLPRSERLRILVTGGAMPLALAQEGQRRLGQVCSMLGSTEMLNLTLTPIHSPDDLRWHHVLKEREVQVVDEAGQPLPAGQVGVLRARLYDGLRGYLNEPELSRQFFRDDWFYPGDLAAFGEDGRLALHGRVTEVLNVMGNKVAPAPLEQALTDRLGAEGVCIFDAPNANGEEELHVAIQPGRPLTRRELEEVAKSILRNYPRVHFHSVESLPRNHMGKVMRLQLRGQVLGVKQS